MTTTTPNTHEPTTHSRTRATFVFAHTCFFFTLFASGCGPTIIDDPTFIPLDVGGAATGDDETSATDSGATDSGDTEPGGDTEPLIKFDLAPFGDTLDCAPGQLGCACADGGMCDDSVCIASVDSLATICAPEAFTEVCAHALALDLPGLLVGPGCVAACDLPDDGACEWLTCFPADDVSNGFCAWAN